jgi:hypothetical protein
MEFITNHLAGIVSSGLAALALWGLKKIPNEAIYSKVESGCYMLGASMTLGLSKWKWTKDMWNKTVEPYFVDLIDNTVGAAVQGFIKGLKSDD